MIQVVIGDKGSGKTKRLISLANEALKEEKGVVVYIDDDKRYMYDLRHEIRFVDVSEFHDRKESTAAWVFGLISGMISVNYDISIVYVDAFVKLINAPLDTLEGFFKNLEKISAQHNVDFVLSVSADPDSVPEFIRSYAI